MFVRGVGVLSVAFVSRALNAATAQSHVAAGQITIVVATSAGVADSGARPRASGCD
jgi:hypothetical protein